MSGRAPAALALGLAAALLAATTGDGIGVAALGVPIALAPMIRRRLDLATPGQVLALLGCGMVAFVWTTLRPPGPGLAAEPLRPAYAQLAFASLLFAGMRLHVRSPAFGLGGTLGIGLLVFLACGTVRVGAPYPALLLGFAVLSFFALRCDDVAAGGRPGRLHRRPSSLAATALVLGLTASLGFGLARAIPRFYALAYGWALDWVAERQRAGFHDGPMALGALHDLLVSDEVVLRVEGDAGDHLSGQVYTHYSHGRWLPAAGRETRAVRTREAEDDASPGDGVRAVIRRAGGPRSRFFLPEASGGLRFAPDAVTVDAFGGVRVGDDRTAERVVLLADGDRPFPRPAPAPDDLTVPDGVGDVVSSLAAEWTAGATSAAARIAAIRASLERGFVYTLERAERDDAEGRDPLLAFLVDDRAGHCEYFASAMTLLARAAGVPARLVTGYRVVERNPLGDWAVVRERHAHAWSEVYLADRGWVSVDPSPLRGASPAAAEITPWWPALIDYAVVWGQRRGLEALLVALVVGLAAAQIWRIRRDHASGGTPAEETASAAPPWLAELLLTLARAGLERRPSEPLEALARRVRARERSPRGSDASDMGEAAVLLRRYTALRYGGEGSAESLRDDCARFVARAARRDGAPGATAAGP